MQLPLPVEKARGEIYSPVQLGEIERAFQDKLLLEHNTYSAHYFHAGAWWTRPSAQVFNEVRPGIMPALAVIADWVARVGRCRTLSTSGRRSTRCARRSRRRSWLRRLLKST